MADMKELISATCGLTMKYNIHLVPSRQKKGFNEWPLWKKCHEIIQFFLRHFLNICHVPQTVRGVENTEWGRQSSVLQVLADCPQETL